MPKLPEFPFPSDRALRPSPLLGDARSGGAPVRVQLVFGDPAWLVTRYEDARTVLSDPAFGRDHDRAGIPADRVARMTPVDPTSGTLLTEDPPDHTRLRRFVYRTFTPRRVEGLRPGTRRIADRLLDAMIGSGAPADLVEGFGLPLPIQVICDLLGVPVADRARFTAWTDALLSTSEMTADEVMASIAEMNGYLADLAAERVDRPTDDLIGSLVRERIEGDRLSDDELNNLLRAVLGAGFETTASQIPNFVFLLLDSGDYARLAADPGLVPTAVEELLRYVPLIAQGSLTRFVLEETELGGVRLRPGEQVLVELAAANRDAAVFSEAETLELDRESNPHIAFGHGLHRCLGASLARMELQVALAALTERLPGLRLAVPADQVPWHTGRFVHRPRELLVSW
ncbi:cytochrome P450 [Actinomadura opuntiae]|uniref:cytochrome P450 n=1 Tax=Actinomadura sp. OS1-43 TaxID=604315 RepID=UPI00255B3CAA|nr:cytochrome P450 [Actinomadura sp. OS1-43]MDL4815789.1 cytochrome P450 [Actinomadura sp. OS1-43]